MENYLLEMKGIRKSYPGVTALDNVHLRLKSGEVHGLIGENGAGKSTLIKILAGAITPDSGTIQFSGRTYTEFTPKQALDLGIGVIYQEFYLVPYMTVAENIFLGKNNGWRFRPRHLNTAAHEILLDLGIDIAPNKQVSELSVAYQQMVEIAKAVSRKVKLIVMDEPTAPLSTREVERLFKLIQQLRTQGIAIIYISHRLEEIFEMTENITVFRDGQFIRSLRTDDTSRKELISLMVGRDLNESYPYAEHATQTTVLEVKQLSGERFRDISFELQEGEVLGLSGLVGSGRTEVARSIFGADPIYDGEIWVKGSPAFIKSPKDATRSGIALIPEDRKQQGLHLSMSVKENTTLSALKNFTHWGWMRVRKEKKTVNGHIQKLKIKTPKLSQCVRLLSGGNQQKVVLAKWLETNAKVLILDEPTRGIDIGAKYEIYNLICELTKSGFSILMISSEMPELIGVCNRILVMSRGRKAGILNRSEFNQDRILELATS